jgi:hypothetical protein
MRGNRGHMRGNRGREREKGWRKRGTFKVLDTSNLRSSMGIPSGILDVGICKIFWHIKRG